MEQEAPLDFKAIRAKFQEEAALKQMKSKPVIPVKPKLLPPPGVRIPPLSPINPAAEKKTPVAPRVVFKDAKRPLPLPVPYKPPARSTNFDAEGLDQQQKKEGDVKEAFKHRKLPLVLPVPPVVVKSAPVPPVKSVPPKKKAFFAFKSKFSKAGKESAEKAKVATNTNEVPPNTSEVPPDSSDVPPESSDVPIDISEVPPDSNEVPPESSEVPPDSNEVPPDSNEVPPDSSEVPPDSSDVPPDSSEVPPDSSEVPPDSSDVPPDSSEVPPDSSDVPPDSSEVPPDSSEVPPDTIEVPIDSTESSVNPSVSPIDTTDGPVNSMGDPTMESPPDTSEAPPNSCEGPAETCENLVDTNESNASITENMPSVCEDSPDTTDIPFNIDDLPAPILPPTMADEEAPEQENGNISHDPGLSSEPRSPSPQLADAPPLEGDTADQESTGTRTPPCDSRVLKALEKAKRKFSPSPLPASPPPPVNGDHPREPTPSRLCPELPPIDYEDQFGPSASSVSPDKVDGSSLRHFSPSDVGGVEPAMECIIPPPRKFLPDLESLGPLPEKPPRPPFVDLSPYQITYPEDCMGNAMEAQEIPDLSLAASELANPECAPVESEVQQTETPGGPDFETSDFEASQQLTHEVGAFNYGDPGTPDLDALNVGAPDLGPPESGDVKLGDPLFGSQETELPEAEAPESAVPDSPVSPTYKESESLPGHQQEESHYESCDNVYEDVEAGKFQRGQNGRKRKGTPKNPYADSQPVNEESHKSIWFFNSRNEKKVIPEAHDDKELKKKEKQRLEKEKKEQKEREKKENEMRKKFKITGQEEAMYQAKVILPSKGRKDDLPVKSLDIVSIIRTTNCPKGKWLARDCNNKYGYISVKRVELDIKEMLELGKKAQAAGRTTAVEGETASTGSRSSNLQPMSASFTDDSEEWTCDDDDTLSPTENIGTSQAAPVVDMYSNHEDTVEGGNLEGNNMQARHEALQKLATFFQQPRETPETGIDEVSTTEATEGTEDPSSLPSPVAESSYLEPDEVVEILPPPELYADSVNDDLPHLPTIGVE